MREVYTRSFNDVGTVLFLKQGDVYLGTCYLSLFILFFFPSHFSIFEIRMVLKFLRASDNSDVVVFTLEISEPISFTYILLFLYT